MYKEEVYSIDDAIRITNYLLNSEPSREYNNRILYPVKLDGTSAKKQRHDKVKLFHKNNQNTGLLKEFLLFEEGGDTVTLEHLCYSKSNGIGSQTFAKKILGRTATITRECIDTVQNLSLVRNNYDKTKARIEYIQRNKKEISESITVQKYLKSRGVYYHAEDNRDIFAIEWANHNCIGYVYRTLDGKYQRYELREIVNNKKKQHRYRVDLLTGEIGYFVIGDMNTASTLHFCEGVEDAYSIFSLDVGRMNIPNAEQLLLKNNAYISYGSKNTLKKIPFKILQNNRRILVYPDYDEDSYIKDRDLHRTLENKGISICHFYHGNKIYKDANDALCDTKKTHILPILQEGCVCYE